MEKTKSLQKKLCWLIYLGLGLVVISLIAYFLIARAQNTPEAVYRRAMKTIGVGIESFTSPEALQSINQLGASGFEGYLTISGIDRQDLQSLARGVGLRNRLDPDGMACFGQIAETDNEVTFNLNSSFNDPSETELLGAGRIEARLKSNEDLIGDLQARFVPDPENPSLIPPLYFKVNLDSEQCLNQGIGLEWSDLWNKWWLIDLPRIISEQSTTEIESLLDGLEESGQLSQDEANELSDIFVDLLQTYVFTSDSEQMILQIDGQPQKQAQFNNQDGFYHYEAQINPNNTISFMQQLNQRLANSQAYQRLLADTDEDLDLDLDDDEEIEQMRQSIADFNQQNKIEVWINSKTKMLRNIRITDIDPASSSQGSTFDIELLVDDDQNITISLKFRQFSTWQCQGYFEPASDCPYLNYDQWLGQRWLPLDAIDNNRQEQSPDIPMLTLKDDAQPEISLSLSLNVSRGWTSMGLDFHIMQNGIEVTAGIKTTTQQADQTVIAPADARPIEEFSAVANAPLAQRENARVSDVNRIAAGVNQYIATRNKLPSNYSEISYIVGSLDHYAANQINNVGSWKSNLPAAVEACSNPIHTTEVTCTIAGEAWTPSSSGKFDWHPDYINAPVAGSKMLPAVGNHDYLVIISEAACDENNVLPIAGRVREMVIIYSLEGQSDLSCLEI